MKLTPLQQRIVAALPLLKHVEFEALGKQLWPDLPRKRWSRSLSRSVGKLEALDIVTDDPRRPARSVVRFR